MNRRHMGAFLFGGAFAALATLPCAAQARRISATACVKMASDTFYPYPYVNGYGSGTAQAGLLCAYPDAGTDTKESVNGVLLDVKDNSTTGSVQANACAVSFDGNTVTCSGYTTTSGPGTGYSVLTIAGATLSAAWGMAGGYASLYVVLPPSGSLIGIETF